MKSTTKLAMSNDVEAELNKPHFFHQKRHGSFELLGKDSIPDFFAPFSHYVVVDKYFRYDFIALNSHDALKYFVDGGAAVSSSIRVFLMDYNFSGEVIEQNIIRLLK